MFKSIFSILIILLCAYSKLNAQATLYVDVMKGRTEAKGDSTDPFASLDDAVKSAKSISPGNPVTIKIAPGLYVLTHQVNILSASDDDTTKLALEALIMPDDNNWTPASMPVIQSISANNIVKGFKHSVSFEIQRSNVAIRGLKFVGNANPGVQYFYPIKRDSIIYKNLEVSQCYFIGERNSTPIQGAVYAVGGAGVSVDHCIFYGCKNAVLLFLSPKNFSLTNSIIYGAYEAGVWFGYKKDPDEPFVFSNNIVSHCHFFWSSAKGTDHPLYTFSNSLISDNDYYMGVHDSGKVTAFTDKGTHKEINIIKSGKVILSEVALEGLPKDYLNLSAASAGKDLGAGIFKTKK